VDRGNYIKFLLLSEEGGAVISEDKEDNAWAQPVATFCR